MSDVTVVDDDQRRLRILLGVLAGIVVLALLWFFVITPLLLGDDADSGADTAAPTASQTTTADTSAPDLVTQTEPESEEEILQGLPIETYEIFLARDPFDPVVPATTGTDGTGTDGTGTGTGTDGTGTDGTGTGGTGTDGTGTDGTDGIQHNAALIDVFVDDSGTRRALIRVGDLIYTVGEGDIFADGYTVISIDATCVTLEFQGQIFSLCEGGGGTGDPGGNGGTDGNGGTGDNGNGGAGGTDGCRGQDEVVCDGRVVTLVDVFTDANGIPVAVVQVDSTLYEVRRGDTFAQNFQVISVDPPCVTLLFGDDAFTLCEGQRTLK